MPQDLTVEFGDILETPTVFPEEQGTIEVTVTNQGDEDVTDGSLNLYASTDSVLDDEVLNTNNDTISRPEGDSRPDIPEGEIPALRGTDELLGTVSGVNLAAGEERTFTIDFASEEFRTASVVSPGAYNIIAEAESDASSGQAVQFISSDGSDVILDWNSTFLNAVQAEGKAGRGVAPPLEARNGAILHLATYDAVDALSDNPQSPERVSALPPAPEGASQEAAAVGASYTVLSELYPEQEAVFAEQRDRSLADISDDPAASEAGFNFGVEVAQQTLEQRSNDGANQADVDFEPGDLPGDYQQVREPDPAEPLPDGLNENGLEPADALLPDWREVTPFAIDSTAAFLPPGPPSFSSPSYADDINEVRLHGGLVDTDVTSVERTEDETEVALFWSYDRPDTFRPPGQWNQIAQEVALDEGNSLEDNALLFAELNVAMADAGIVAWDGKYAFEQLRPVTAIRNADEDNNPNTTVDPEWEPLILTPNFPDYISGHATFGGAAAGVLENSFGNDVEFEIPSQELPGVSRLYAGSGENSSFAQAAEENADSRLFGGVHVDISNGDGVDVGFSVANSIDESDFFA